MKLVAFYTSIDGVNYYVARQERGEQTTACFKKVQDACCTGRHYSVNGLQDIDKAMIFDDVHQIQQVAEEAGMNLKWVALTENGNFSGTRGMVYTNMPYNHMHNSGGTRDVHAVGLDKQYADTFDWHKVAVGRDQDFDINEIRGMVQRYVENMDDRGGEVVMSTIDVVASRGFRFTGFDEYESSFHLHLNADGEDLSFCVSVFAMMTPEEIEAAIEQSIKE